MYFALYWISIFAMIFVIMGWGKLLARMIGRQDVLSWDVLLLCGMGLWGVICFVLLWSGLWQKWLLLGLFFLGLFGWYQSAHRPIPKLQEACIWGLFLVGSLGCIDAWGPMIDTDALYYHQALAKQMAIRGTLIGGWFEPNGSRPMLLHSLYAFVWQFWGDKGPSLFYLCISLGLIASVVERAKAGVWGLLLLVSSWSFMQEVGVISNNIPTAFAVFLTWRTVCEKRLRIAMWLAFVALSYKLTCLGLIFGIWLIYVPSWRIRAKLCVAVCVLFSLWPMRNLFMDLPLLFPFSGWEEPFQNLEKYGMGRSLMDFIWLPWNIFAHAKIDSHQFQGQLSWMLFGACFLLWKTAKKDLLFLFLGFVFWAVGPQWLRHLILLFPIFVFVVAKHVNNNGSRLVLCCGLILGMSSNWGPLVSRWSAKWETIRGETDTAVFLSENIVGYDALQWANKKVPPEECISVIYLWGGAVLDRPYILSSVEDHIPIRSWLQRNQEQSFDVLSCRYLVVGKAMMTRKRYAFLSDERFQKQIAEPLLMFDELLIKKATLVYTAKGNRVYRLQK